MTVFGCTERWISQVSDLLTGCRRPVLIGESLDCDLSMFSGNIHESLTNDMLAMLDVFEMRMIQLCYNTLPLYNFKPLPYYCSL